MKRHTSCQEIDLYNKTTMCVRVWCMYLCMFVGSVCLCGRIPVFNSWMGPNVPTRIGIDLTFGLSPQKEHLCKKLLSVTEYVRLGLDFADNIPYELTALIIMPTDVPHTDCVLARVTSHICETLPVITSMNLREGHV